MRLEKGDAKVATEKSFRDFQDTAVLLGGTLHSVANCSEESLRTSIVGHTTVTCRCPGVLSDSNSLPTGNTDAGTGPRSWTGCRIRTQRAVKKSSIHERTWQYATATRLNSPVRGTSYRARNTTLVAANFSREATLSGGGLFPSQQLLRQLVSFAELASSEFPSAFSSRSFVRCVGLVSVWMGSWLNCRRQWFKIPTLPEA